MRTGTPVKVLGTLWMVAVFAAAAPPPDSPVADAAMRGDTEAVRALLKEGADVNTAQGDGMTALHWAAKNGHAELVELLIYAGGNLQAVTRVGDYTPLHLASMAGHAVVAETLLDAGSDPNARTTTGGATPLHFAAASGDAETVSVLQNHGADADARETAWGQTPLMWAAADDRVDAVKALLAGAADLAATSAVVDVPARHEAYEAAVKHHKDRLAALRALEQDSSDTSEADRAESEAAREQEARGAGGARRTGSAAPSEEVEEEKEEQPEPLSYADLVGNKGGLTPLLFAARQANVATVLTLLEAGADINQVSEGDHTSPLLIATLNGHFDLALLLLERGADPNLASDAGTTPLYAAINAQWAPKAAYPQPTAYQQQNATYLALMEALLEAGADPNVRLVKHLWYMEYNFPRLNVNTTGATPFWRAAYGTDVEAMRLLVRYGADPHIPTEKVPEGRRPGDPDGEADADPSGLPPVPVGGPGIYPIHAASGVGYGEGFGANAHRHAPGGWLASVQYLVDELGADVNARDLKGYNAIHHAASRGDSELILYLVEKGGDVTAVSRRGQTTADMANGPVQRTQPYPDTVELLESLGSKNNHNCVSC